MQTVNKVPKVSDGDKKSPKGSPKGEKKPLEPGFTVIYKFAVECVYLALKTVFIKNKNDLPPLYAIEDLVAACAEFIPIETKTWIEELIQRRIEDKNAEYQTTPEYCEFIDSCLSHARTDSKPKEKFDKWKKDQAQSRADDIFLSLFDMQ